MSSLVSVIVPIYKVEQYLDKCIKSIVDQTYRDLEIILVDDGSPDSCPKKCDEWAEKDDRIKVIHKQNGGLGFARNSGLDIATGDYIMFVDSDDYLSLNAIEVMYNRSVRDGSDLVITKWATVYENGQQSEEFYNWMSNDVISDEQAMQLFCSSSRKLPVFACGKLYRRGIFENIRYNAFKCAEDLYVLPDIIKCCKSISIESSVTYFYLQRAQSIMHTRTDVQNKDSILSSLHVSRFLLDNGYTEGASRYYYSAVCKSYELKNDKEIKKLINDSYTEHEIKQLKEYKDKRIIKNILMAKYPSVYKLYKLIMRR